MPKSKNGSKVRPKIKPTVDRKGTCLALRKVEGEYVLVREPTRFAKDDPNVPEGSPLLENLTFGMCRMPLGKGLPPYAFCGKLVVGLGSFCPEHRARLYEQTRSPVFVPRGVK